MQEKPTVSASGEGLTETRFPCHQCGAVQTFSVGSGALECNYCGFENEITRRDAPILEHDLHQALKALASAAMTAEAITTIHCPTCAANFEMDANTHAGECVFCGTAVVTSTEHLKPLKPEALLPFAIDEGQARSAYKRWLKKLWFAPNALKKYASDNVSLNGVFIPYWTYDSRTVSAYSGQRGDVYYVNVPYIAQVNGRSVRRMRREPRIRWTPVSGRTRRHFDDVLIGATHSLPRKITDWLEPWDLNNLEAYNEAYLSGFTSEVYQVDLDEGVDHARRVMDEVIRRDVARDIGGDQQRIHHLDTQHFDNTFKHILLPLWTAAFRFRQKSYRFVVNGRTGKVQGERPYSYIKIALAVVAGLCLLAGVVYGLEQGGGLESNEMWMRSW